MDLLIDLMNIITDAMIGADQINRNAAYSRNTDISWFIQYLEDSGSTRGLVRCSDDAFCLGDAILVFAVEPLLTPEGKGLADVALRQLEDHGVRIDRVAQPFDHVLSVTGMTRDGSVDGRILASRGWVFLATGPDPDVRALSAILDEGIAEFEARSTR